MISVIVPSYNQSQYLRETLDSIASQTDIVLDEKPDMEVIVVDDGSTDNSLQMTWQYPFQIVTQANKGLASARNTGIMNSIGRYVFFLDADDILLPHAIARIKEVIAQTDADIVAPSFKEFGVGNRMVILHPNITLDLFRDGQNYLPYFCAVKREKLLAIGGYSPRMTWGWEDLHLWINLLSRGAKVVTIPEVLVLYRTKEQSMWTESVKHKDELFAQIRKDFPLIF